MTIVFIIKNFKLAKCRFYKFPESVSSLELERVSVCIESFSGADKSENSIEFRKRTLRNNPIVLNDPSRLSHLRNFSHIDYRNCQCVGIVDSLFWQLYQQLKDIGIDSIIVNEKIQRK